MSKYLFIMTRYVFSDSVDMLRAGDHGDPVFIVGGGFGLLVVPIFIVWDLVFLPFVLAFLLLKFISRRVF